jgi:hypothetical protein
LLHRLTCVFIGVIGCACGCLCQQLGNPPQPGTVEARENTNLPEPESKRIFGIIPNYRTSPGLRDFKPLPDRQKFKIATQDAFDRGTFALAAVFAGEGQLTNANRSFGQGVAGYGKYYAAAFADFAIGDYMTEAIYPSLLHQDPRYFRKGMGSGWSRLGYAMGQIFWTHTDSGGTQFNFSEVIGNSTAVAISNAYYSDNRTASDAISKLGTQLGVDMASNILKEFWPDFVRKFRRKHNSQSSTGTH